MIGKLDLGGMILISFFSSSVLWGNTIDLGTVIIPGVLADEYSSETVTIYARGNTGVVLDTSYPFGGLNGPNCNFNLYICGGDTGIDFSVVADY